MCRKAHFVAVQAVNSGVSWLLSLTLQPDCLLQVGLIAHALRKGGLSDHTSLCTISVHVPVGLLHPQQILTFHTHFHHRPAQKEESTENEKSE